MIAFVADLMFRSKVKEMLVSESITFLRAISDIELPIFLQEKTVIVDLSLRKLDPQELIKQISSKYPQIDIIAYGSHVDVAALRAAKENGAKTVMVNSAFVNYLEDRRAESIKSSQKGAGWLTFFVFSAIVGCATWYIFQLIPIQYKYYELENAMHSIARISKDQTDEELRKRLIAQMKDIGTPGDYSTLSMDRSGFEIRIQYAYSQVIAITVFGHRKVLQSFSFTLDVTDSPQV